MSGNKVFVGNLDYDTREADLIDLFKSVGKIASAKIVRSGMRSRGYGFVEYENDDDAIKAVDEFDKVELLSRSINVQISNSENSNNDEDRGERRVYDNRDRDNRDNRDNRDYRDRRRPQGNFRSSSFQNFGGGGGRRNNYNNNNNFPQRRFNGGGGGRRNNNYRRLPPRNNRRIRRFDENEREERREVDKIESKTTVFVANLPFDVDDAELVQMFIKCGSIKTAHVVTNRGRSKGFGFVEFEDQEGQSKAIEMMDNLPVENRRGEERNLAVKIAMVEDFSVEKPVEADKNDEEEDDDKNDEDDE